MSLSAAELYPTVYIDGNILTFTVPCCAVNAVGDYTARIYSRSTGSLKDILPLRKNGSETDIASACCTVEDPEDIYYLFDVNDTLINSPLIHRRMRFFDPDLGEVCAGSVFHRGTASEFTSRLKPEDRVFYLLNVRGASMEIPNVQTPGTFRALGELLPHIVSLGVTSLILMPVQQPASAVSGSADYRLSAFSAVADTDRTSYWGYVQNYPQMTAEHLASRKDGNPETDFIRFLDSAHEYGLEVILQLFIPSLTPAPLLVSSVLYWYELGADGIQITGSGRCKGEIFRNPSVRRYMRKGRLLLCEDISEDDVLSVLCADDPKGIPSDIPVGSLIGVSGGFMDRVRRYVKSDRNSLSSFLDSMFRRGRSVGILNYVTSHDGFTLSDLVSYDRKHNEENGEGGRDGRSDNFSWNCGSEGDTDDPAVTALRIRQKKNLEVLMFLSQGNPLILAGDECGNSQKGNNNTYNQDNHIGWVNWSEKADDLEFCTFMSKLAEFRRRHSCFHMTRPLFTDDPFKVHYPEISFHSEFAYRRPVGEDDLSVGIMYVENYGSTGVPTLIFAAVNMSWQSYLFGLPLPPKGNEWYQILNTYDYESFRECPALLANRTHMEIPPRSIVILQSREGGSVI